MERNKSQIKVILLLLILLISFILIYTNISYANSINKHEFATLDINPKYLEWEKLSAEEKLNTIIPSTYSITLKESIKRSTYNSLISLGANSDIDEITRYSLKDSLKDIIVKNQLQTNDCWAFSTTSMIETTIAKKYNKVSTEYSPMHLEYYVNKTFNKGVGAGGNGYLALAYLASGKGPAYERELPFSDIYDENNNLYSNYYLKPRGAVSLTQTVRAQLEEATFFASIYKDYDSSTNEPIYMDAYLEEYSQTQVEGMRNLVKEHILNNGGVTAVYHAPEAPNALAEYNKFYNAKYSAWYCNDTSLDFNHQITIVGWDDNFGWDDELNQSKFNSANQPKNNGAWIVLNSWGDTFGEAGYMYISYDDCHIENMIMGINDIYEIEEEGSLDYDNLYEYDPLGLSAPLTWSYYTSAYLANVFTRDNTITQDEYLTKVGIFLDNTQGIEVYVNTEGNDLNNLTKVATFTGSNALTAGYHTIDITPVQLTGEKFVVAVKYINSEGGVTLPFECNLLESGLTTYSNYFDTATANAGESYRSWDGKTWKDLNNLQVTENGYLKNTNACIKAFTIEQEAVTTPVTDITLNKTQATLEIGETLALTATVTPENATNKNVIWSSSSTNVATVSESGVVTAITEGTTTISAVSEDCGKTDTCTIIVKKPVVNVTGISLNKTSEEIEVDSTVQLIATITPSNATDKNVSWTSSNRSVATVSTSGVVTAVSAGTTTITATTADGGKTATCTITVKTPIVNVTGITLNRTSDELKIGATVQLIATITPSNATDKNVTWTSSNRSVATVSTSGVVTAVSAGTATITGTTVDGGKTANYTVIVQEAAPAIISVTGVALNKTQATLKIAETLSLIPTITPSDATNKNVSWSSSNTNIAIVNGGVVTAIAEGTTTITVTTEDGEKTATCIVTVEKPVINVTGVTLNKTQAILEITETLSLIPTITPSDATNKNVSWSSSDTSVATVNGGIVTAVAKGSTTITVTTEDGNKTSNCIITVEEPELETVAVTGVSLNKTSGTIKQGSTLQLVATIIPASATNKDISWSSSNPEVATVKGGVVTGVSVGTAIITVTTADGSKTANCTVTVEENTKIIPVTSVSLTVNKVSLEVGTKYTFVAKITPTDATNKELTWISSDDTIVEVSSNGLITAKKEGTATITVITDDGLYTASAEVTVRKKVNTDDDIYTEPDNEDEDLVSGVLPETGETLTIIVLITIISVAGIVFIIKFKKYDLK